ncbi:MAG: hypothetical protein ACRDKY_05470 [Solirubrobacteraceae bacterium]
MTDADDLLQRALTDAEASAAVALKVPDLPLSEALTVIFHGRRDLGTLQTYVAHGGRAAGSAVGASELLRVPCDLDLSDAGSRDEAEELYAAQARALRDAIVAADTVLAVWAGPLAASTGTDIAVDRSIELNVKLPAPRLMPVAITAPERRLLVAAVCGARTLAEGRPPLGIVCAQQDLAHVYPLSDDPERCLEDFEERAAAHARLTAQRLDHQEASVQRFLELNGDDFHRTG